MTVAVWVGYPDRLKPMETEWRGSPVSGGTYPASIWKQFMLSTRALFQQKLAKQCEDEDAKKTEKCRAGGPRRRPHDDDPGARAGHGDDPERHDDAGHRHRGRRRRRTAAASRRRRRRPRRPPPHRHAGDAGTARAGDADAGAADAADAGSRGRRRAVRRRRDAGHGLARPAQRRAAHLRRPRPGHVDAVRGAEPPRQVRRLRDADPRPDDEPRPLPAARRRADPDGTVAHARVVVDELDAERLRQLARARSRGRPGASGPRRIAIVPRPSIGSRARMSTAAPTPSGSTTTLASAWMP